MLHVVAVAMLLGLPVLGQNELPKLEGHNPLAPAPRQVMQLDYVVLLPVPLNQYDPDTPRINHDPTIIPYSGCQFLAADGTPEPWRKRLLDLTPHRSQTGGIGESTRVLPKVDLVWRYPRETAFHADSIKINNDWQPEKQWTGGGGSLKTNYASLSFETPSLENVPRQLDLSLIYTHGKWQPIAKADAKTPLPVGDDNMQIAYLGKPRPDSPAVKQAIEDEWLAEDLSDFPFGLEMQTTTLREAPRWKYEFNWDYADQGKGAGGSTLTHEQSYYELWTVKVEHFKEASLRRIALGKSPLDRVDLRWLDDIDAKRFVQRRVEFVKTDRFTEPRKLKQTMSSRAPDSPCLLDLDTLTVYKMPAPMPEGVALAKHCEELGIDLMVYEDDGRTMKVAMLACSAFILQQRDWDRSPSECFNQASRGNWRVHQTYWPAWRGTGAVLVTTAEGGVVLLRVTENKNADGDQPGSVQFEVREFNKRRVGNKDH